jgi:hypothetical protein
MDNPRVGPKSRVRHTRDVPPRGPTASRAAQRRQAGPTRPSRPRADHRVWPSLACGPIGSAPPVKRLHGPARLPVLFLSALWTVTPGFKG